jgi:hypothetical protein
LEIVGAFGHDIHCKFAPAQIPSPLQIPASVLAGFQQATMFSKPLGDIAACAADVDAVLILEMQSVDICHSEFSSLAVEQGWALVGSLPLSLGA